MVRCGKARWHAAGLPISVALAAGGCGGGAPPSERLVNSEAAIRGAIEINANVSPPRAARTCSSRKSRSTRPSATSLMA